MNVWMILLNERESASELVQKLNKHLSGNPRKQSDLLDKIVGKC